MQAEATVHEGSVVIPPAIKEALHIREGDTIVFDADQESVRLRVRPRASFREFVGICGNDSEGKSIEQIVEEEREWRDSAVTAQLRDAQLLQ